MYQNYFNRIQDTKGTDDPLTLSQKTPSPILYYHPTRVRTLLGRKVLPGLPSKTDPKEWGETLVKTTMTSLVSSDTKNSLTWTTRFQEGGGGSSHGGL